MCPFPPSIFPYSNASSLVIFTNKFVLMPLLNLVHCGVGELHCKIPKFQSCILTNRLIWKLKIRQAQVKTPTNSNITCRTRVRVCSPWEGCPLGNVAFRLKKEKPFSWLSQNYAEMAKEDGWNWAWRETQVFLLGCHWGICHWEASMVQTQECIWLCPVWSNECPHAEIPLIGRKLCFTEAGILWPNLYFMTTY